MATTEPGSERAVPNVGPAEAGEKVASQVRTMKSTFGLFFGAILVVIGLSFAALGQLPALSLLLIGVPLAIWGGSNAERATPKAAARSVKTPT